MKKFLSIMLALAMVVSCLTIVSFAEKGAGIKISGDGSSHFMRIGSGVGDGMATAIANAVDGKGSLTFNVYNTGSKKMALSIYFQNGWGTISGAAVKKVAVEPGYAETVVLPFTIKDGKLNGTCELSALTLRFDLQNPETLTDDNGKVTNGAEFIIESLDLSNTLMMTMDTNGRTKTAVTSVPEFVKKPKEPVATVNGNAESANGGEWTIFGVGAGSTTLVEGGANGTAHSAKYSGATNAYGSIGYKLGASIIDDSANGYNGGGAGTYKITFWTKAEDGKGGDFKFVLNSLEHKDKGAVATLTGIDKDSVTATYMTYSDITITDTWEKQEIEFEVSEEFLNTIKAVYKAGTENVYNLILRLDGSGSGHAYNGGDCFAYYVDEVTIEKVVVSAGGDEGDDAGAGSEETATPTPTPTPKVITGVKFTFNEEYDGEYWFISSSTGGVVSAANVKDGTLTKTVTVKNNGKEDITVAFYLEALVSGQWKHPVGNDSVVVEPGKAEVITYECDVEDGNVSILDEDVAIEKLFFRFNVVGADGEKVLPEGTSFTIYSSESDSEKLLAGATVNKDAAVREYVYDSPNGSVGTGDVLPVAFIALTVVASVALIVVCKKKREEF